MLESEVGVSVAVTLQKGGSPVIGLEPGGTKTPVMLSVADVIVVSLNCMD